MEPGVELLEIKSGSDYKQHSALNKVRKAEGWSFVQPTVFCKGNLEEHDGVKYVPWYMVMFLTPFHPTGEMKYEIDLTALNPSNKCY